MLAEVVHTRSPRKWPSASSASRPFITVSRPWASDMNDSERSAVHLTGRRSLRDAQETIASSA